MIHWFFRLDTWYDIIMNRDVLGRFTKGSYQRKGENNPNWKGDYISKAGIHAWLVREYGKPKKCENCKSTKAKRYDWANIGGVYKRDRQFFMRLCRSCHVKMDKNYNKKDEPIYKQYEPKNIEIICKTCKKQTIVRSNNRQFCSKSCWYNRNKFNTQVF